MTDTVEVSEATRLAVERGAALLDEKIPDWWKRINPLTLDISRGNACTLGQVFSEPVSLPMWKVYGFASAQALIDRDHAYGGDGDESYANQPVCISNYVLGKHVLGLNEETITSHGFNVGFVDGVFGEFLTYPALDAAWADLVRERQTA